MDKRQFLKIYTLFAVLWGADFLIKLWFYKNQSFYYSGLLSFHYTENHGIFLGVFSRLPLILKTVFLSTLGIFLVASFPLIAALYSFKSKKTIYGLMVVLAGILGNVTDRLIYGHVIDYLFLSTPHFTTPVMNFADIIQWGGYLFLAAGLITELSHIEPENNKRNAIWIDKPYQMKFSLTLLSVFMLFALTFVCFGFTFLKYSLMETGLNNTELDQYLKFYFLSSFVLLSFSSLVILLIGKTISGRIAGPGFAVKRYLRDTLEGKCYPLKFRENDHLRSLEEPLSEFNRALNEESKRAG